MHSEIGDFKMGPNGRPIFSDFQDQSPQFTDRSRPQSDGVVPDWDLPTINKQVNTQRNEQSSEELDFMNVEEQSADEISIQEKKRNGLLLSSIAIGFERKIVHHQNYQMHALKTSKIESINLAYDSPQAVGGSGGGSISALGSGIGLLSSKNAQQNQIMLSSNLRSVGGGDVSLIQTLDAKAKMVGQPTKTLASCEKKGPEIKFRLEEGRPIKFFQLNTDDEHYTLSDELIEEISKCSGHITFVSITGLPKTGKTFILNQIIEAQNGDSYQKLLAEEGVVMWSYPLYNTLNSSWVFFIDTCLDLTRRDHLELHYIVHLISSAVLVNSSIGGTLNEDTLKSFESLLKIRDVVKLDSESEISTAINLAPSLILLLRDFSCSNQLPQTNYLDDFLFDEIKYLNATKDNKKINQRILKYFKQRQLIGVACPVDDKRALAQLDRMDPSLFNEEFMKDLFYIRKSLLNTTRVKEYKGVFFNATMFISFVNSFLEDASNKNKLNITKAFSVVLDNEFIREYNACIQVYFDMLNDQFAQSDFKSIEYINRSLLFTRECATEKYFNLRAHDSPEAAERFKKYYQMLLEVIQENEQSLIKVNREISSEYVEDQVAKFEQINLSTMRNDQIDSKQIAQLDAEFSKELLKINSQLLGDGQQFHFIGEIARDLNSQMMKQVSKEIADIEAQHKREMDIETNEIARLKQAIIATEKETKINTEMRTTITSDIKTLIAQNSSTKNRLHVIQHEIESVTVEKTKLNEQMTEAKKKVLTKCFCCTNDLRKYEIQQPKTLPQQQQQQPRVQAGQQSRS